MGTEFYKYMAKFDLIVNIGYRASQNTNIGPAEHWKYRSLVLNTGSNFYSFNTPYRECSVDKFSKSFFQRVIYVVLSSLVREIKLPLYSSYPQRIKCKVGLNRYPSRHSGMCQFYTKG
uniref:Uncharacterized protein n=1 Tax=Cacopsylla melanoneura TaxID=428564 RepID=A0A8D9BKL4_9HEMI